jgi:hypothetical protein
MLLPPRANAPALNPPPAALPVASIGAKRGTTSHATSAVQSAFARPYSSVSCLNFIATMQ